MVKRHAYFFMINPVIVGRFGKTCGIHGWIRIYSFIEPHEEIFLLRPWFIKRKSWEKMIIEDAKTHGSNLIVKLPGCNNPEDAQVYVNLDIAIEREQLPQLPRGEYYWSELEGLRVVNAEGVDFGKVDHLMETGANDVLVVVGEQRRLVPYISNVVLNVDLKEKIITVDWNADF